MKGCKRCLYFEDHPLGLTIDEEGICSGCRVHEEKDYLDWDQRWTLLEKLVDPYRLKCSANNYDCVVPVTGANDSYFIVHTIKERLGLNPLLVSYNKYFNTPLGIRNLANLRSKFNVDILVQNVNPNTVKKITRSTLRRFGSIYWPILAGGTVFPVQTAVRFGIPLIVWGAHQGLEQVGMFSHTHEVEMTRRNREDHDLFGYEAEALDTVSDLITEDDVWQYLYPDDRQLETIGVRGIYLGNYVRWDPKAQHELMVESYGYESTRISRTFDTFDHGDCFNYMNIHDLLKLYKHGYSKVTDHATREIRHGRLSREAGIALVKRHEHAPVNYLSLFADWLGMDAAGLQYAMDQHRSKSHWTEVDLGQWEFHGWSQRHQVPNGGSSDSNAKFINFNANSDRLRGKPEKYITIGKGYP